jgi:peptidoglycan/LPS O-acetylase OafA/YrhL
MGVLRILLALSVVVAHVGPLLGLRFFGGGVMAVETFYMLSGFYMALVLSTRYRSRTRDFYFNRFLRLFPVYWLLLAVFLLGSGLYWMVEGHPLGTLAVWQDPEPLGSRVWAGLSNLSMIGSDWAQLYSSLASGAGRDVSQLIAIGPVWTLAVEITFYLAAPFILRLNRAAQAGLFLAALLLRAGVWVAGDGHWTVWLYYFSPATWVFFLGGIQAYHLLAWLEPQAWFARMAVPIGRGLLVLVGWLILFYTQADLLRFEDWRYFAVIGLALPFLFAAFKDSAADAILAGFSYPLYLAHWVILSWYAPLRHFIPPAAKVYVVLFLALGLCGFVQWLDKKIQRRFKRAV